MPDGSPHQLVDHFFRREYGRLVATLSRVFGLAQLDRVEDMVQSAMVEALQAWRLRGVPAAPAAWIHRVARNKLVDALRHEGMARRLAPEWLQLHPDAASSERTFDELFLESSIEDSQLRMVFATCHPRLSRPSSIALTLRAVCGFSNAEIARGLLVTEANIRKRIYRARRELTEHEVELEVPAAESLPGRLDSVHHVFYLMFNEGYSTSGCDEPIRVELCEEAARLCFLLSEHPTCSTPATNALLALMLFHAARFEGRLDSDGGLLLLEDQDRARWDRRMIAKARQFLDRSACGDQVSAYHLEAGIAMHHCRASDLAATDWPAILSLYDALVRINPSPVVLLNRAIVRSQIEGPEPAIIELTRLAEDPRLRNYHLLDAALGEMYARAHDPDRARRHLQRALQGTRSPRERDLLLRKISRLA